MTTMLIDSEVLPKMEDRAEMSCQSFPASQVVIEDYPFKELK